MAHNWNEEQLAIFAETANTQDNLMIEAAAGAAKTTTLVELSKLLRGSVLCLAFNKKIADEMTERMPKTVDAKTLNSLGHRIWGQATGKRLSLSDGKIVGILREVMEDYKGEEEEHLRENFSDIVNICKGSKNHGHVPDSIAAKLGSKVSPLMTDRDFYEMLPEEPSELVWEVALRVITKSFEAALNGAIDFADQLLMPTVMKCMFPSYENILVDEAQDLSELNHVMLRKLVKRRIIAVGDSKQAIYAFRGAHTEGMPLLAERFNMRVLHLSTTFRCPEAICEHIRWHMPRIKAWEGNPNNPGEVRRMAQWAISDIPDGAAVICRNNAPLFAFAIKMIRSGRRPYVWGNDVAAALVKSLESLGAGTMKRADALKALSRYHAEKERKLKKESAKANLADRVLCMKIFIDDAETLAGAIKLAENVLNSKGKVDLATGHKSKGHEWQEVFFLDSFLIGDDGQENNLRYVIATRARRRLTYIDGEHYVAA